MSPPTFHFDHASVCVGDVEQAREFYGTVLGFEELNRPDFNFPGAWFQVGHMPIHLTTGGDFRGADAPVRANDPHVAISVEGDFDKFLDDLRSQGVEVVELENSPAALRQTFVKDPWGNVFEFCVNYPATESGQQ